MQLVSAVCVRRPQCERASAVLAVRVFAWWSGAACTRCPVCELAPVCLHTEAAAEAAHARPAVLLIRVPVVLALPMPPAVQVRLRVAARLLKARPAHPADVGDLDMRILTRECHRPVGADLVGQHRLELAAVLQAVLAGMELRPFGRRCFDEPVEVR